MKKEIYTNARFFCPPPQKSVIKYFLRKRSIIIKIQRKNIKVKKVFILILPSLKINRNIMKKETHLGHSTLKQQ